MRLKHRNTTGNQPQSKGNIVGEGYGAGEGGEAGGTKMAYEARMNEHVRSLYQHSADIMPSLLGRAGNRKQNGGGRRHMADDHMVSDL